MSSILTESQIDNILVAQKDKIIRLINDKRLQEAETCLSLVIDFWYACRYHYKVGELLQRINDARNS